MRAFNFSAVPVIFLLSFGALGGGAAFAQIGAHGTISMPSSPAMPSVSTPALGNGFYTPGSKGFYNGSHNVPAQTPSNSAAEENDSSQNASASAGTSASIVSSSLAGQYSTANQLSNALTANEINSLDNLGMIGSFSSLLGKDSGNLLNAASDTRLLQQILSELTELKKSLNSEIGAGLSASKAVPKIKTTPTGSEAGTVSAPVVSQVADREPSILRFVINGTDIISSCKTVYFSKPESDGTFLLTGDRKYTSGSKNRFETFHLLFHANGTKDGSTTYTVTPALTQDSENTSSYIYKLCQQKNLTATKTGNLVTMRCSEKDALVDLLLAIN